MDAVVLVSMSKSKHKIHEDNHYRNIYRLHRTSSIGAPSEEVKRPEVHYGRALG
jgi:hypothetical protein